MFIAIIAAVLAGACFAGAGVLQQRAASRRPGGESLSLELLGHLVRDRMWLGGISLAILSYGFQSLALSFGPLALVQPLIVTELIFALPISARLHDLRLGRREWLGALAVAAGLAVAVVAAHPREGNVLPPLASWLWLIGGVSALALVAVGVGRASHGTIRASTFALAAGTILGAQSSLLAATIRHLTQDGIFGTFLHWQTYLLVVASILGLLLVQSAYQAGPLAASLPVFDSAEPVVAIVIGIAVFGEAVTSVGWRLAIALAGLVVVVGGIVLLDTSPLVQRMQKQENKEAEKTEELQTSS